MMHTRVDTPEPRSTNTALLDVLVPAASGTTASQHRRLDCALAPAVLAAIERRAERLGLPVAGLGRAALAILESRLTGNPHVCLHEPAQPVLVEVPPDAVLDDWLRATVRAAPVAAASEPPLPPSAIGAWVPDAAAAEAALESVPLAWWIETGAHATLRVAFVDPPFDAALVTLLAAGLQRVLAGLADSERLQSISVLDAVGRERLLRQWNATAGERRAGDTVHGVFAAIAQRYPDRVALAWDTGALSYAALDARAERIATGLRAAGVVAGATVALLMDRCADAIAAMLGILKAGAAYLPLDPAHPRERLAFALAQARVPLLLVRRDDAVPNDLGARVVAIDELLTDERLADAPGAGLPTLDGAALAYVMYTSGSTGTPKGVAIPHRAIIRLVCDVDYVAFGEAPCVLHAAPLGFDASTFEIWGALLNGGTCVIHAECIPSGPGLAATIARHQVRIAWLTAALFNTIVDLDARDLRGLEQLLIGGEALSVAHVRKAFAALPDTAIINGYGPTECTTFAATYAIPRDLAGDAASIPIGRPIADTQLYVLNTRAELVPVGVIGELFIGGAGLARGYLGQPELTAERFVAHPFDATGERLYRTGDRVRWLADGVLEFVGRIDGQVKLRGYRIETGEIETVLQRLPGVRAAVVIVREDRPGQKRLVAYYVADDATIRAPWLRQQLASALPEFMRPAVCVRIDALPLTPNGKLDRRALPTPDQRRPELAVAYAAAVGATEQQLCALFADVLGVDGVGRHDNFFDLGGNSLLAMQTLARIASELAVALPVTTFFRDPTPVALAAVVGGRTGPAADDQRIAQRLSSDTMEPVAIIAMAGRFPGAGDVEAFWHNLVEGREGITFFADAELDPGVPREQRDDPAYVRARGVIDNVEQFDAAHFGITPREAELMDPQQRIFLELCWECLERGGYVPDVHAAPVGVFAGMYNASYFQRHVSARPDLVAKLGAFQVMLGNEKDYIATRVAHRLNLTGPAISVHTACSTSLVAICQAFDALRAGQCAMALAGGVSVTCPPRSGYVHQEGTMLSPDGHTRSFDADAQGTVFSDGAAVVLLKRLADALADGDPVIAVIRGGAVNNDGAVKASFTAPSSAGQAAVITMALARAGVEARSISYVETHGTATPVGDPIEIEGLTQAFRRSTDERGFCAIGSLKSNVGHLVIAAGAAGVIKTALALQTRSLPPSLHLRRPNPHIDFASSPFVVNDVLRAWPAQALPRRAGVSSFGVGGTNAHVILEEAPERPPSDAPDGPQLLLLSARTPAALTRAARQLGAHLAAQPDSNLADVAHTLRVGRKAFAQRAQLVASDMAQAIARLADEQFPPPPRSADAVAAETVFLFPGQGAQYAGMGAALHATEPVFRAALDACADIVHSEARFDLREHLFGTDAQALRATAVTQPATFAIEYALARLWISLGVQPAAMVGHSVGEFVAAVIAGVMSLDDGLRLVARRGQLMQAQPAGSMLSVRLDAERLLARLPAELSLAAENAPNSVVVAGPTPVIEAFHAELERDGIASRVLQTSHAFHSAMMDAVLEPFQRELEKMRLYAPSIPIMSTLTGGLLSDADALSAHYWTRHLREPVRFSAAARNLLDAPQRIFLEVGPRTTLCTLIRQQPLARERVVLASLADAPDSERSAWLGAAGQLWCSGVPIVLDALDRRACRHRVRLPTYPFERKRHWVEAAAHAASATTPPLIDTVRLVAPPVSMEETPMAADSPDVAIGSGRHARLLGQLKELFEDVSGAEIEPADVGANFIELGLDSLSLTQIALQLQKTFALKITFRELMEDCSTLESLARRIDQALPPEAVAAPAPIASAGAVAAALPEAVAAGNAGGGLLQQVIQQQMQIMQQQLALLGASAAAPRASGLAAAPPRADVAPIAAAAVPTEDEEAALAHTKYDVKKAFGAIARIHSTHTELTERQHARLNAFMRRYIARTRASKEYTQLHRPHLADPRVVNGFRPLLKEIVYQIVVERSRGAHLWDLDGNEYVDALNGFGMNLFGWQPPFVLDAVRRQLDLGYEIGPQHPLAGEVARLVCDITGFDRAALCNTGSEAVMGTIRVARTITGRDTLVIFAGSYHGIFDEVIVRGTKKLRSVPAAPGILRNTADHVLVLDYGTPETLAIIKERAHEIAAVLVEPVQSRRPDFQPREFLRELRAITREAGALLIFDEVVTGFRAHPRGAQEVLGIDADLASYGKVVGGGFPIGVIAGKRAYMDALDGGQWQFGDDSIPTVGVTYFAGTFVRHPLALAAAKAVLEHIKQAGSALQERLNARTATMAGEMNAFSGEVGAPVKVTHFASVWKINFLEDHPLQDLLFAMMRSRGIHLLDNFPCFFTTAHEEADFVAITEAFKGAIAELQEAEWLPRRRDADKLAFDAARPPVAGARLGKDPDGKPAWFVPNPDAPGKYMKVDA